MKVLVCEGKTPELKQIVKLIKSVRDDAEVVATVETGEEAISAIHKYDPDLIFMDITLTDCPYFETLGRVEINVPIIFTTAYDEYALKAFKLRGIDYLVKPITKRDIEQVFDKFEEINQLFEDGTKVYFQKDEGVSQSTINYELLEKLELFLDDKFQSEKPIKRLFIKSGETINIVHTSDIRWIEATGNYVTIGTGEKKYLLRKTLASISEKLDQEKFFQIHRSTILNVDFIMRIEEIAYGDYKIILNEGEELKMSRNYNHFIQLI